jgi:uncharacterized protein Smg (DUF494 family)
MVAAVGWIFAAVGWARVMNVDGDDLRLEALRQVALVMVFASAVTAGAAAAFVW